MLTETLEELLAPVVPHIPKELVSEAAWANIAAVARGLPGAMTSFVGFECRLGRPERRADFLVRTRADGGEREYLGCLGDGATPDHQRDHDVWRRLREFAARWGSPESPINREIDRVWLEFDVDRPSPAIPLPSVFLGHRDSCHRECWMTESGLPLLRGGHLPVAVEGQLKRCVDALPAGARVFSVGAMLARDSEAVRLCITGLGSQGIMDYLERIRWNGASSDVRDLLTRWSALVDHIGLQIDVGETVGPRIGLEYHGRAINGQLQSWRLFVEALVRDGLCLPEKRDGLFAYAGASDALHDRERWPRRLLRASTLLGADWVSVSHRSMQYIKIACEPEQPPEAKAYLGAMYSWFNQSTRELLP